MNLFSFFIVTLLRLCVGGNSEYKLNQGTFGAPIGGWNLSNYLAGSQTLGPYPVAIPTSSDPNSNPNLLSVPINFATYTFSMFIK
jgi:hypothetical protein